MYYPVISNERAKGLAEAINSDISSRPYMHKVVFPNTVDVYFFHNHTLLIRTNKLYWPKMANITTTSDSGTDYKIESFLGKLYLYKAILARIFDDYLTSKFMSTEDRLEFA